MIIYHGSESIIEKPELGKGKPHNDYGLGFYCTEHIELAKEWSCAADHGGYANKYELNLDGLKILNLNGEEYTILHWISILLSNRRFALDFDIARLARNYISENFPVDTDGYDVITGYRANDSYFSYARDFLQNTISIRQLSFAMKLGNLGDQIMLISPKAFSQIDFLESEEAPHDIYYPLRMKRDKEARDAYFNDKNSGIIVPDDIYVFEMIRDSIKADDERIR